MKYKTCQACGQIQGSVWRYCINCDAFLPEPKPSRLPNIEYMAGYYRAKAEAKGIEPPARELMDIRLTDGEHWVRLPRVIADQLVAKNMICPCISDGCPRGTYHPISAWYEIEQELVKLGFMSGEDVWL